MKRSIRDAQRNYLGRYLTTQRYIKQLASQFGNKVSTKLTGEGGRLEFEIWSM